ncbi:ribosome production factor 2 homolog isoform X1 [Hylaeus volcanicus]|uniref:ribosome production factor 2 homolog isoform X1 n=1 Tax=Hylaeus volcanicus TaxID=313075 RepID=UPI0023B793B2|nr:ribosome production factor 2 homolog isoform X1 [Hylaeus volcanicus]XP_053993060.1 ribosome production factor 2 homolog isoform X1 [Hylaeus volcanicus]XP_053993061.1 ribosome production factor 2 homolog isoform X1 [Hylaeus volcanicus]XP_053993062.1 ribosome production factor 2 homolog isoform X1 [Hylaeus volcanicus]XP_053993063.1 ribosome production factor 2 homolog isoform X1 [Hylaeus volcanicus]XP_053993064.1 ribosome production factor 2 homolog isoform X1 [Hylaeus volcanicus]XP_05399306
MKRLNKTSNKIKKKKIDIVKSDDTLKENSENIEKALEKNVFRKAKTAKGRRYLQSLQSKLREDSKNCLYLRGTKCSASVKQLLKDLFMIGKPYSQHLSKKHDNFNLLSNKEPIEFLCRKNNTSLFCYGSSTKEHPSRLIMGRIFDDKVLDLYECDVQDFVSLQTFVKKAQPVYGTKPLVISLGAEFETCETFQKFRNFLIDFFVVGSPQKVLAKGLDQIIAIIATPGATPSSLKVSIRRYKASQAIFSTTQLSDNCLDEVGPSFTLCLSQHMLPETHSWRSATKQPKALKPKKTKNISTNNMRETLGCVHVGVQDLKGLNTRHYHKNKRPRIAIQ